MILAPDAHNNPACPIWDRMKVVDFRYPSVEQNILAEGSRYYSSRAGGPFLLMPDGARLLDWESPNEPNDEPKLTCGQKVNLSYWIYQHNLDNSLLDKLPNWEVLQEPGRFAVWMNYHRDHVLKLDKAWVEGHLDCAPSAEDRMLNFLRELIRSHDASEQYPDEDLLKAAGGCRKDYDLLELERHAVEQGWTGSNKPGSEGTSPYVINLPARIHVDEQLRERGGNQRGEHQQAVAPNPAKNESEFTFSNIQDLPIEEDVVPIVKARLDEVHRALSAKAHLSVIFLCGSVLEGVLVGAAKQDPEKFKMAQAADSSSKPFHDWSLVQLIDVACEIEVLPPDVKEFGHGLRNFRNYIHPYKQMKSGFTPDERTAGLCLQALDAALASLAGER